MKNSIYSLLLVFFCITFSGYSQNEENKWAIDIGSSSVLYTREAGQSLKYRIIRLVPRVNLTRYIAKDFSIAGSAAYSLEKERSYMSFDGEVRYGFGTTEKKIFNIASIYSILGGSLIFRNPANELLIDAITLNFGGGGTLWLSDRFGLNSRLVYKFFANSKGDRPRSHFYGAAGIVYQFSLGGKGNKKGRKAKGGKRSRIWE